MKKILYTIFGTFLLTSCLYDAMYFLTDEDLEWMEPYEQGDTVLFQSSGGIDTMTIDKFMLYNDDNPWRENEGTSIFMGNSSFKYTIRHSKELIEGKFLILKEDSFKMSIALRLRRRHLPLRDEKELQLCSQVIEGIQYDDLIIVDDSNSELYTKAPFNTEYFIWSKSKGLLQYKYLNGDVYTFYKKLPYKK